MNSKVKIKIIKKNALKIYKIPVATQKNVKRKAVREMILNVSAWVDEFQQLRCEETKQALDFLSTRRPQISRP